MVLTKLYTSRTIFCNCAISFNYIALHLVNKFIFHSKGGMRYTTNSNNENKECLDTRKINEDDKFLSSSNKEDNDCNSKNASLQKFLPKPLNRNPLYLINSNVAKTFVNLIKDDLLQNASYVVEMNPGFGFVTKNLLECGVPFVHLCESNRTTVCQLERLGKEFPNRINLLQLNLLNTLRLLNFSNEANSNISKLFNNIPSKKWEEESCMQIIGMLAEKTFINYIITDLVFQSRLFKLGRPSFYLGISSSIFDIITAKNHRMKNSFIVFNILFNYKVFGTVDRSAFIPQPKKEELKASNSHVLYVIKMEPKPELFTLFETPQELVCFWFFVRHYFYKPSKRVIPSLEKIIPNCGSRLIAMNYNIYTEFNDLSINQVYELYKEFQSWPGFDSSVFVLSMKDKQNQHLCSEDDD